MVDAGLLVSTMALRNPHHVLVLAGTLAALAACASQPPPEPEIASAAGEFGYAARYPGQLGATRGELLALENKTGRVIAKFPNYPSELKDPDWSRVLEVVERADQAGRSAAYVARTRHVRIRQTADTGKPVDFIGSLVAVTDIIVIHIGIDDVSPHGHRCPG